MKWKLILFYAANHARGFERTERDKMRPIFTETFTGVTELVHSHGLLAFVDAAGKHHQTRLLFDAREE